MKGTPMNTIVVADLIEEMPAVISILTEEAM